MHLILREFMLKNMHDTFCEFLLRVDLSADFHVFLGHIRVIRREIPQLAEVGKALLPLPPRYQGPRRVDNN